MAMPANPEVAIAILAKAPVPGYAKTRLIPALGAGEAAALHARLLHAAVRTALAAGIGPVTLWCAPDSRDPEFAACRRHGPLTLAGQPDGDLGTRMRAAIDPAQPTLIMGSDCPALTAAHLHRAAAALVAHDAVLIPAEDGGYVLIGLRRAETSLFRDIAWSTPQVLPATRDRLRSAGLTWQELPPLWDVDRPADLARLAASHPELAAAPAAA
jgi:rSAM/selenodomain-associated transferase 1